jgi:hypothetical protein
VTPEGVNRVDEDLDGIGTSRIDHIDAGEIEEDRPFAGDQVRNAVDRRSRPGGQRLAE